MVSIDDIKSFFFEAMSQGYVAGAIKREVPGMPGFREIEILSDDGEFRLIDRYSKTLGVKLSTGVTYIWFQEQPVWSMWYRGHYAKSALPALKAALVKNYELRQFDGGRGPAHFHLNGMTYMNQVNRWKFEDFDGYECIRERVVDGGNDHELILGSHHYGGGVLI